MWAKRAQEYLAKINSGELAALAEVVRDLQAAGDGSGSSFSQRNLFELALDRLAAEFAAVNRTAKAEAVAQLYKPCWRQDRRPASRRRPTSIQHLIAGFFLVKPSPASHMSRKALFSVG